MPEINGGTFEITNSGANAAATFEVQDVQSPTMSCFAKQGEFWVVCDQFDRRNGSFVPAASMYQTAGNWQED